MSGDKVTILGAGFAGLTTAVYLAEAGFEVTIIEANDKVSLTVPFNGSLVVPSLTQPWCNPNNIKSFIYDSLLGCWSGNGENKSIEIEWDKVTRDRRFWKWLFQFTYYSVNPVEFYRIYNLSYNLSLFSQQCLRELLPNQDLGYSKGTLQLFTNSAERDAQYAVLSKVVKDIRCLSPAEVQQYDDVLSDPSQFQGGALYSASDTSMDIHHLCLQLETKAKSLGVRFIFNTRVDPLTDIYFDELPGKSSKRGERTIARIKLLSQRHQHQQQSVGNNEALQPFLLASDFVIVTAGNWSNIFSEAAGDGWHSWPMKGVAMEVPIERQSRPLSYNIVDDVRRNYIAPLEQGKVRLSGHVGIGHRLPPTPSQYDSAAATTTATSTRVDRAVTDELKLAAARQILKQANSLLPSRYLTHLPAPSSTVTTTTNSSTGSACSSRGNSRSSCSNSSIENGIKIHVCYRPQTPDDLPVVGQSASVSNLYYNSGHGHLGLTRIAGCSRLLTDAIIDRRDRNRIREGCTPEVVAGGKQKDCAVYPSPRIEDFDPNRFDYPSLRTGIHFIRKCLNIFL